MSTSCYSPWQYNNDVSYGVQSYDIGFKGSTSVAGYSLPSEELCLLGWKAPYSDCKWGGKWGTKLDCKWVKGKHYWYDCWSTPSIDLLPNLDIAYDMSIPMQFTIGDNYTLTAVYSGVTIPISSFTIYSFVCSLTVNGSGFNLSVPLGANGITYTVNSDPPTTYQIGSIKGSFETDSIKYDMTFTFNIVACANYTPPQGWLNIQVICDLSVFYEGTDDYSVTFSATCPIVSVG